MSREPDIMARLEQLEALAPAGYALALHIHFTTPTFLLQTYPKAWTDYYSQNGLVMSDPTVAWGFENTGTVAWSSLGCPDNEVMQKSAEYGLNFGLTCAIDDGTRSLGSLARSDREFTAEEDTTIATLMQEVHDLTAGLDSFSPTAAERLRKMSVRLTHPSA